MNEQSPISTSVDYDRDVNGSTVAIVTIHSGSPGRPAVFGPVGLGAFRATLMTLLDEVRESSIVGVVLTGEARTFCAGADLDFMASLDEPRDATAFATLGHEVYGLISQLGVPVVAAINGTALGGGLELALHCASRVASDSVRAIGLPELSLGLIPGWGGTTLLPRLVGLESATTVIVDNPLRGNKLLTARDAHVLGIIDEVVHDDELLTTAIAMARKPTASRQEKHATESELNTLTDRVAALGSKASNPSLALSELNEVITGSSSVEDSISREIESLATLILTTEFSNRVYSFHLTTQRARKPAGVPGDAPIPVARVGVIGAGLMASQFAGLFAERLAVPVVMTDVSQERLDAALERISYTLATRVSKGTLPEAQRLDILDRIVTTLEYNDFSECDFVMEAVFEDMDVKRAVLTEMERHVSQTTILATNTSSLSVSALAESLAHPERLIGFHFFNPVAVMSLIEIVATDSTSAVSLSTAAATATALRKSPVIVKDLPGFVVNRVLSAYLCAVFSCIERGATTSEISEALSPLRLPMDPFALTDLIGRRVTVNMLDSLHAFAPQRFPVSGIVKKLAENSDGGSIATAVDDLAIDSSGAPAGDSIRTTIEDALATEIDLILNEGVVSAIQDVDLCLINGSAWPVAHGGISKYLDASGASLRARGVTFHPESVR